MNTNWDVLEHTPTKTLYLRYNRSWLQAKAIEGPWTPAGKLPESFSKLPPDENWKDVKAAIPGDKLSDKAVPRVFVSTDPAELIAVQGPPSYLKVEGATTLLWVNNTESDLFRMGQTGDFYFLVAGRWFKSASLDGPWTFATPSLPEDFKTNPRRASALACARVRSRHAAGDRSRAAGDGAAHRARQQERAEGA